MASAELSKSKSLVILAVVVGCFAILWPNVFYPMFQNSIEPTQQQTKDNSGHMRPERHPPHLHPENMHPALREKGRVLPTRTIEKQAKPGPMPGMRPPMGGAGHVVPAPAGAGVGILMPIYTIGIVIFFLYTMMRIMFKKPEDTEPRIKDFHLDPEQRKFIFAEEYCTGVPGLVPEMSVKDYALLQERLEQKRKSRSKTPEVYTKEDLEPILENVSKEEAVEEEAVEKIIHKMDTEGKSLGEWYLPPGFVEGEPTAEELESDPESSDEPIDNTVEPTSVVDEKALRLAYAALKAQKDDEVDQLRRRLEETERAMERIVAQMGNVSDKLSPSIVTDLISSTSQDKEAPESQDQTVPPEEVDNVLSSAEPSVAEVEEILTSEVSKDTEPPESIETPEEEVYQDRSCSVLAESGLPEEDIAEDQICADAECPVEEPVAVCADATVTESVRNEEVYDVCADAVPEESTPVPEEECPVEVSEVCADVEVCPVEEEVCSAEEVVEVASHPKEEECPVAEEECPVVEEECPVAEEECPVVEKERPVAEEECPVVEEECPVTEEQCPVVEEESVAVESNQLNQLTEETPAEVYADEPAVEVLPAEEQCPVEKVSVVEEVAVAVEVSPVEEEPVAATVEQHPVEEEVPITKPEETVEVSEDPAVCEEETPVQAPEDTVVLTEIPAEEECPQVVAGADELVEEIPVEEPSTQTTVESVSEIPVETSAPEAQTEESAVPDGCPLDDICVDLKEALKSIEKLQPEEESEPEAVVRGRQSSEERKRMTVVGMEVMASMEDGGKMAAELLPKVEKAAKIEKADSIPHEPVPSVFLDASIPAESHLVVSEAECRAEAVPLEQLDLDANEYESSPVVLSGKMTLSVIGVDAPADGAEAAPETCADEDDSSHRVRFAPQLTDRVFLIPVAEHEEEELSLPSETQQPEEEEETSGLTYRPPTPPLQHLPECGEEESEFLTYDELEEAGEVDVPAPEETSATPLPDRDSLLKPENILVDIEYQIMTTGSSTSLDTVTSQADASADPEESLERVAKALSQDGSLTEEPAISSFVIREDYSAGESSDEAQPITEEEIQQARKEIEEIKQLLAGVSTSVLEQPSPAPPLPAGLPADDIVMQLANAMADDVGGAPTGASKGSSPDMEEYEVIPDASQPKESPPEQDGHITSTSESNAETTTTS